MSREESLSIENLIWRLYSILVSLCLATMLSRLLLCITSQKKLKSSLKQIFEAKPKWLKKKHFQLCLAPLETPHSGTIMALVVGLFKQSNVHNKQDICSEGNQIYLHLKVAKVSLSLLL